MLPVVAGTVVLVDQVTKTLAVGHLDEAARHLIGPFGFQLAYNTGSAFSLLQGGSWPLFVLDALLVVVLGRLALKSTSMLLRIALSLIIGGAIGNMVDRATRGHNGGVVDFITLSHWPTFNVADSCITIGAALVIITLLFDRSAGAENEKDETVVTS